MWRCALVVVLGLASVPRTARAECRAFATDWIVPQGELVAGRACGSWVGATNGATIAYSFGQFTARQIATVPYRVTVTWRRLGSDARALELHLLGAALLLGHDRIGLWIDDPTFEVDGFHPLHGHQTSDVHTVSVVQTHDRIEVTVDGRVVDHWAFAAKAASGTLSVAFKGGRGVRARMWFEDFRIDPLDQSQLPAPRPK